LLKRVSLMALSVLEEAMDEYDGELLDLLAALPLPLTSL
jgi:hypothetical protein